MAPTRQDVFDYATQAAQREGVPVDFTHSILQAESGGNVNLTSPAGAIGPMQLMPDTAKGLGVNPADWRQNVDGGVRFLSQLSRRYSGDPQLIAAAYNAGPGAVDAHGGVPPYPETQAYVQKVTGRAPAGGQAITGLPSADAVMKAAQGGAQASDGLPSASDVMKAAQGQGARSAASGGQSSPASGPDFPATMTMPPDVGQPLQLHQPGQKDPNGQPYFEIPRGEVKPEDVPRALANGYQWNPQHTELYRIVSPESAGVDPISGLLVTPSMSKALADARQREAGTPGAVRSLDQGAVLNFGDELDAAAARATTAIHNGWDRMTGGPGAGYTSDEASAAVMEANREAEAAYAAKHPGADFALRFAGGFATPGIGAAGKFVTAPSVLAKGAEVLGAGNAARAVIAGGETAAKSAAVGAGYGALAGAGQADDGQRLQGAVSGAETGGTIGAVLPAGVRAVGAVAGGVRRVASGASGAGQEMAQTWLNRSPGEPSAASVERAQTQGPAYVQRIMQSAGKTEADIASHPAVQMGMPITLAEAIGPNGVHQATAMARRAGTAGETFDNAIAPRMEDHPHAIVDDLAQTFGVRPEGAKAGIDAVVQAGQDAAKPLYDAALGQHQGPVWTPELAKLAQRDAVRSGLSEAATNLRNQGKEPFVAGIKIDPDTGAQVTDGAGRPVMEPQPTAELWHDTQKIIGSSVKRDGFGKPLSDTDAPGNFGIRSAQGDVVAQLKQAIPGYREAQSVAGDYLSVKGAFDKARGMLFSGKATAADVQKLMGTFTTDAQRQAAGDAIAADIFDRADKNTLNAKRLMTQDGRKKLAAVFGPENVDDFLARLQQRVAMKQSGGRIMTGAGSPTGEIANATAEQDQNQSLMNGFKAALKQDWVGAAGHIIGAPFMGAYRGASVMANQAVRNEAANILAKPAQEGLNALKAAPPSAPPRSIHAITTRALPGVVSTTEQQFQGAQ